MSEPMGMDTGALPLALERQVDELCDEFEVALRRGVVPEPDEFLARIDKSAHRHLLHELTKLLRAYAIGQVKTPGLASLDPQPHSGSSAGTDTSNCDSAAAATGSTTRLHLQRSFEILKQLDDSGAHFAEALERGELLKIEEIVASATPEAQQSLRRQLLTLEMEFRAKKGHLPRLEEYQERFSEYRRLVKFLYYESFVPESIGGFTIQRLLGSGGFGHVYQGWDTKLSRSVALKVFRRDPDLPSAPGMSLLFEARAAAQLRHPGIVTVFAILPDSDGDEFLVMEYVDGRSLEDLLRSGPLSPRKAAELTLSVVNALQHSHLFGLVHRDLKPANILLDHGHLPRVTDFGLALNLSDLRRSPEIAGTIPYMAPEQASGETHRLDGRTDLWAVGVTLYRMLSGRLPFSGANQKELIDAICHREPDDLLQIDATIPLELVRIVRRCLTKRMSERYQSTLELADDLTAFLNPPKVGSDLQIASTDSSATIKVVPKGLRCFDGSDREFFLGLVPGARDRFGVPQEIRFWEHQLRELDPNQTFRVGLIYGPSGCGKSSLMRAGIIPQLPDHLRVLIVEATRDETEQRLKQELLRRFPGLQSSLTLSELFAEIREGTWLQSGEKLVIVLDQLEQWLHGSLHARGAPLYEALRQCDGGRVQAVLLVRDDFWMPATRLFQQIDVPLIEGFNAAAVDLFDADHAMRVLAAFGVAYGRLDPESARRSQDEQRFLIRAIDELSEDGWVMPVRLCIFVEMLKSRLWTTATLRMVGGTRGLGTTFLEDVFDGRSASPMHRLQRSAARLVLERLLPPLGTNIRGHLVSEDELRSAAGYEGRREEFTALLRCLDHELRLITPIGVQQQQGTAEGRGVAPQFYQLTHDYLVAAIRDWLNQSRRRTMRGRAELRLSEYAESYAASGEARQLPSWWEWLSIHILTRHRRWRATERAMMRTATQRYAARGGALIAIVALLMGIVYRYTVSIHADGLVQALVTCDSRDIPIVVNSLSDYRRIVHPLLVDRLGAQPQANEQRVRILLGLLATGDFRRDELFGQLLEADPQLAVAIIDVMVRYERLEQFGPQLWQAATNTALSSDSRLRAYMALAQLSPAMDSDKWEASAASVVVILLRDLVEDPGSFSLCVDALSSASSWLLSPLREMVVNSELPDSDRSLAASVLARYTASDTSYLIGLALQVGPHQFDAFAKLLTSRPGAMSSELTREATIQISSDLPEEEKDRLARRQSNAILLMHRLGNDEALWSSLAHRPDPRLRSFLLYHLQQSPEAPDSWLQRLSQETDPGVRQALVMILAAGESDRLSLAQRTSLTNALLQIYRADRDSGVHCAAHWSLGRLGAIAARDIVLEELATLGRQPGFHWYVTKSLLTMIIFESPGDITLGSPESEPGRDTSDETRWVCPVTWSFAISAMEITQSQYLALCPNYKEFLNEHSPLSTSPANAVSWLESMRFCRLLDEHDGTPESEMVAPPADSLEKGPYHDMFEHSGYRLPIEPEWEIACRAGSETPRPFGYAAELVSSYCCYIGNSNGHCWSVGSGLPNAAGVFDALGNVNEWCFNIYTEVPKTKPLELAPNFRTIARYAVRGNDHGAVDRTLRSANRRDARADELSYFRGFRIAHTIRPIRDDP